MVLPHGALGWSAVLNCGIIIITFFFFNLKCHNLRNKIITISPRSFRLLEFYKLNTIMEIGKPISFLV